MATPALNATAPSAFAVELRGVTKTYKQVQRTGRLGDILQNLLRPRHRILEALINVDLQVRHGEIVAYAGPNGAGKSTTIKLLTGLLAPDSGDVRVLGMDPMRERARYVGRIAAVFGQRTELWWDHPVATTFEWKRVVWGISDECYTRMLGFLRELLGLDDFFQTLARELSLGQKTRADLALALLHEPEVLFLDEPTLGLDVLAKRNILSFIKEVNREKGVTVVLTSHDMSDLEQLADRIVLIDRGKIAFDGDFHLLRRSYSDRRELIIESPGPAPSFEGAALVRSAEGRHEYSFDASRTQVSGLLAQAAGQDWISDFEVRRAPIDDVIADIYESWRSGDRAGGDSSSSSTEAQGAQ